MNIETRPLFVLEMANNHNGSLAHGLAIVRECAKAAREFPHFAFAVKMQYRDLSASIRPEARGRKDIKLVKRFEETALTADDCSRLRVAIADAGLLAGCTPFDEPSVGRIAADGFDFLKVASAYCDDWKLLEAIAAGWQGPVILSTGGASLETLDRVVQFIRHRFTHFALMHCVAEYPTEPHRYALGQIRLLRERYHCEVGWSTHADGVSDGGGPLAAAMGATIFERHVGVGSSEHPLNAYSMGPLDIVPWVRSVATALASLGPTGRYTPSAKEEADLAALRRGAWTLKAVAAGERIKAEDVTCALPAADGQLTARDFGKYRRIIAGVSLNADAPVMGCDVTIDNPEDRLREIVRGAKRQLAAAGVEVPKGSKFEVSAHYGLDRFDEYGMVLIEMPSDNSGMDLVVLPPKQAYPSVFTTKKKGCRKILVLKPGQNHPEHRHIRRSERYEVIKGALWVFIDGNFPVRIESGQGPLIEKGQNHAFGANPDGCVFVETSDEPYDPSDSHYSDPEIAKRMDRKTVIDHWEDA